MKQKPILGCLCTLVAGFLSCSTEFPDNSSSGLPESQHSTERLYRLLERYYIEGHASTRSTLPEFRITDVRQETYAVSDLIQSDSLSTRAVAEPDFTLQTVSMDFDGKSGYAVVSDDERLERVFFFTENGEPSDTSFIMPLRDFIRTVPYIAADMILTGEGVIPTRGTVTTYTIENIVPFQWGQWWPFHTALPYCDCEISRKNGYHKVAGCLTTAVAQYLAKRGNFKGTYYPNNIVDFSIFPELGDSFSELQAKQISNFFLEIAQNCQIQFGCEKSHGHPSAALNYLRELGIDCQMIDGRLTTTQLIAHLAGDKPILISGVNVNGEGHMWLMTGVRYRMDSVTGLSGNEDYWCNWGWNGESNGWIIGNFYTSTKYKPFTADMKMIQTFSW